MFRLFGSKSYQGLKLVFYLSLGRFYRPFLFANMLNRAQKAVIVEELEKRFKKSAVSIFASFKGISVGKLAAFRRELKKDGAEFKVARKTLLRRALQAAGNEFDPEALKGEIGVIFGYEDQVAPAKAAARFAKIEKTFAMVRGILGNRVLEAPELIALSRVPPREELLAKLAWTLNAPIQNLANVLQGNIRNLVVVLNRIKDKK